MLEHNLTFTTKSVEEFMAYYQEEFPNATEDHESMATDMQSEVWTSG